MRLRMFASIFELVPPVHNSERALLLKVRIMPINVSNWLTSVNRMAVLQRQFRLALGISAGGGGGGRGRGADKTPADRGGGARILPDHDLGGAAGAVIAGQEYAVFEIDLVVERLERPDVAVR